MAEVLRVDVAVVGAGPAGLSAAVHTADGGLSVALVDTGARPGGQFWRHADPALGGEQSDGHHHWGTFTALRDRLAAYVSAGRIVYLSNTQVALVEPGPPARLHVTPTVATGPGADAARPGVVPPEVVQADDVVLCPGGYDRQLPVPGWQLPGVMTAGGLQAMLKGSRTLPGRAVVVAGTGPFLLPVATGVAAAGGSVAGVYEANSPARWVRHAPTVARMPGKVAEALGYATVFARNAIRYRTRTVVTRVLGEDAVRGVVVARVDDDGRVRPGTEREVAADLVAFGWGFTPSLELPLAFGAATRLGPDGSLVVTVDDRQRTSVPHVHAAGEVTGIGGADLARLEGELAARSLVALWHGRPLDAPGLQTRIRRYRAFAEAMHAAHPVPARWPDLLTDDTLVCRCEEVPAARVRHAVTELQADDPRTVRSLTRVGMGWCQGRVCAQACALLVADLTRRPFTPPDLEATGRRTLAAPLDLARIAGLDQPQILVADPTQSPQERS